MRTLDVDTQTAIRNRNAIAIRNLVLIDAKDDDNDLVRFGFTDYGENITINIIDGRTQQIVSRDYFGDYGPLLGIDPIPLRIGLEIPTIQIGLSQLHNEVQDMVRNHIIRNVQIQVHRIYLDPASMQPVANPRCRFLGLVNGAPIDTPAAGGDGSVTIRAVSHTRELTRTNPAKRSDESQKLRDGDRFRQYGSVAGEWEIFWGEEKEKESNSGSKGNR